MRIEILYFAEFKEITNKAREGIELNEGTVKELAKQLVTKYPDAKRLLMDDDDHGLKPTISLAINEELMKKEDFSELALSNGDKVAFLLPISGG